SGDHPLGTIDVRSEGFGEGDPTPSGTQAGGSSLTGGNLPAIGYQSLFQTWGATPKAPKRDRLDIVAKNVRTLSVNVQRAHVDCNAALKLTSDGRVTVVLPGCGETAPFTGPGVSPGACRDRSPPQ